MPGEAPSERSEAVAEAVALARRLSRWSAEREWRGTDPYEGLNASRRVVEPLKSSPLGRRLLIQAVKRSPLDLRPMLGIRPEPNAASVAWVVSAYARNGFLRDEDAKGLLTDALRCLDELRLGGPEEPCWGYPFDVQSRVLHYSRGQPNTIATAFAGHALLDAHASLGDAGLLEKARCAGRFFLRRVPQTDVGDGAYFGYLPSDRSPIHNSNMLAAALLARLSASGSSDAEGFGPAAASAVLYTTARQRADGSWPYGERPDLSWVDNFHTGYVLDALRVCADAGVAVPEAEEAWGRGVEFYRRALFLDDGTPRYYTNRVFPVDAQSVAQGIQTLSIAARHDRSCAHQAWKVFGFGQRRMMGDGLPIFQRRRLWSNRAPHFRWVVAPMLLSLSHLLTLERVGAVDPGPEVRVAAPLGAPS